MKATIFCLLVTSMLLPLTASAQWLNEEFPLQPGWNAIWLSIDCSDRPLEQVLEDASQIEEIWRWNPLGSSIQFTESPGVPIDSDANWAVWRREVAGSASPTTLGLLVGNAAYLIKVNDTAASFNLSLTGKPLPPRNDISGDGLNLIGFPTANTGAPTFSDFFLLSPILKSNPGVVEYVGGELSDTAPKNPREVTLRSTSVSRGKAYWVDSDEFSDYYGPLQVTVFGPGGINFGRKLNTVTVRIKNVTDPDEERTISPTITLRNSEQAPGATPVSFTELPLRIRDGIGTNLQFNYHDLTSPYAVPSLAPGEQIDVVFDANRTDLNIPDQLYASILTITDEQGHCSIDLPVSGTGTSRHGVWVGAAVLDSVNQVESISGPEFDAPVGTVNGSGPEITTVAEVTSTTLGGQTTDISSFDVEFDSAGDAYLTTSGLDSAQISLEEPGGTPYSEGTDYTFGTSSRAIVSVSGSDYTQPPTVTLTGPNTAAATATAELSGRVRKVTITNGGQSYDPESVPDITFTGGGGSGASAQAIISAEGYLTDIALNSGGSGYSSAPVVTVSGSGGAIATAEIVGGVGSVTVTGNGSGYTVPPTVTFTPVDENGSGAEATVLLALDGTVSGVDRISKVDTGSLTGSSARVTVTNPSRPAEDGTPDGTSTSTVTSTSQLVTLNGKSRLITRRISSGKAAKAPSNFPIRLIFHAPESGSPTLLQRVYLGQRDGIAYAGSSEGAVASRVTSPGDAPPGKLGRASSASFPLDRTWTAGSPGWGTGTSSYTVTVGYNEDTNPFLHTYHPDHDNWDARYERILPNKSESYTVTREIDLNFSSDLPAGVSDLNWGVTTLGGTYIETVTGLRAQEIVMSGGFILHQVSEAPVLTP